MVSVFELEVFTGSGSFAARIFRDVSDLVTPGGAAGVTGRLARGQAALEQWRRDGTVRPHQVSFAVGAASSHLHEHLR